MSDRSGTAGLRFDHFDIGVFLARASLSARARARLYRKLASLARTGMPLPRALDAIWQFASRNGSQPRRPLALVVEAWRRAVYDGRSFGAALASWVPSREWMIIEAGAGDLEQALEDAAGLIDSSRRMVGAVVSAATYPAFLGLLLCILMWIFSVEAIPAFAAIKPMEQWSGMGASLATLSRLVGTGMLPSAALAVGAFLVSLWSLPRWTGEWRVRFDAVPPWSFYRLLLGTSFLTSLVAFLRAGMPLPEALRRLRSTANPWLRERIDATLYFLNSGYDLGESLHLSGHEFPDREIIEDLRIYAAMGNVDDALRRIATEWVKQSVDTLNAVGDILKVGGMVAVASVIAWIQLGIIAVQQQLSGGF